MHDRSRDRLLKGKFDSYIGGRDLIAARARFAKGNNGVRIYLFRPPGLTAGNRGEDMDCQTCGIALDDDGTCPTCRNFQDDSDTAERMQSRVLMSIVRSVCGLNCRWTEVEGAVSQAEEVGLTSDEIESAIRVYKFRYEDPIVALSEDQNRLVAQLTDRGLVINRCESGPFRQGFTVFKPTRVPGNSRPGGGSSIVSLDKDGNFDEDGDTSDAPIAWVYPETQESWVFLISVYAGGVGPGDYFKRHDGLEPAVADVIDYYFGDPKRMTPQVYIDRQERLNKGRTS